MAHLDSEQSPATCNMPPLASCVQSTTMPSNITDALAADTSDALKYKTITLVAPTMDDAIIAPNNATVFY